MVSLKMPDYDWILSFDWSQVLRPLPNGNFHDLILADRHHQDAHADKRNNGYSIQPLLSQDDILYQP